MMEKKDMQWPGLTHKFGDPRLIIWPANAGVFVRVRDWYFGNYILISLCWIAFACGGGTYGDRGER